MKSSIRKLLCRTFYGFLQIGAQFACSELQQQGIDVNISMLPAARTIDRHLQPAVTTVRRTDAGFLVTQHQTLPGGSISGTAPVAVALLLPALQSARGAARNVADMNNLKHIGLAMHNHAATFRNLPGDIYSKDGKPVGESAMRVTAIKSPDNIGVIMPVRV